ncbi:MAG: Uma2 family endonuclease [Selenomonadaceae bacterium]|nr:Uma2 family endonuclease [Selenomonadaceae bacterium]
MPLINERLECPRYELINGEERMMTQPATNHSRISSNLNWIIHSYLRGKKKCKLFGEVDVYFDENNHYIPDLLVVCDKSKIKYDGIYGAPDLVIEILSPSTAKTDRYEKKAVYEKFGVREYWLVNPKDKSVDVFHLVNGKFELDDVYHDYNQVEWDMLTDKEKAAQKLKLKVSLYDDLEIDVAEIFEDMIETWE